MVARDDHGARATRHFLHDWGTFDDLDATRPFDLFDDLGPCHDLHVGARPDDLLHDGRACHHLDNGKPHPELLDGPTNGFGDDGLRARDDDSRVGRRDGCDA